MGKCEPPSEAEDTTGEQEAEKSKGKRTRRSKADQFPRNLPIREVSEITPPEVLADPTAYKRIGQTYHDELSIKPSEMFWERTVTTKWVEVADKTTPPLSAPAPAPSIPGTKITAELAAQIACDRYLNHLPFYRQSQILKRDFSIDLSDRTLMGWTHCLANHLKPIYESLHTSILESSTLQIDETPIKYIKKGAGKTKNGYLWVANNLESDQIYYHWNTSRSTESLQELLGYDASNKTIAFKGTIQCDGYQAYEALKTAFADIELGGCLAHIRRKFYKIYEQGSREAWLIRVLNLIKMLYGNERSIKGSTKLTLVDIRALRNVHSRPIIEALKELLDSQVNRHRPQSNEGLAVTYALGQWSELVLYLEQSHLHIDNNAVERAIRPTKIGAKNWMFIGSAEAGVNHALLYTLLENAKRAGLNPREYLITAIKGLNKGVSSDELTPRVVAEAMKEARTKVAAAA